MGKKSILFFLSIFLISCIQNVSAQTVTIGTGTSNGILYSPIYRFSASSTNDVSRSNILFTSNELSAQGITSGVTINKLAFKKTNAAATVGNAVFSILMANSSKTPPLATTTTWADIQATHTQVYSTASQSIPAAIGWLEFALTTPFIYTGGNLEIATDWNISAVAGNPTTDVINWEYTAGFAEYAIGQVSTTTSPATLNGTTATYKHRPNIQITYIPSSACTQPPTGGSATATPSGPVCSGTNVTFSLTGNSTGSGQEYRWQKFTTPGGPYTYVSAASNNPSYTEAVASSSLYRAEVKCGSSISYSDSVFVNVPAAFPAGTYTIKPGQVTGGTNFQTFADAVNAIKCGIAGQVVFNVEAGSIFNEQIAIDSIQGTSATSRIIFNGAGATIAFTPTTANRHLIRLDGADFITIRNLNLTVNTGDIFGYGIHLMNGADNNIIDSCTIDISAITSTTQSNSAGIVASGTTTSVTTAGSANFNTISNNTIIGAYQGIRIVGMATGLNARKNIITNNIVRDFYADGIALTHNDSTIISKNNISRELRSVGGSATTVVGTFTGIELGIGNLNCRVDANRIHDTHNSAGTDQGDASYGIFSTGDDAPGGSENFITNNLIYNFNSETGTQYGLYNSSSNSVNYYHNTVVLDNAASTAGITRGFYQVTLADSIDLRNNIFYITRGGTGTKHALYFGTNTSDIVSDKNVLFVNATGTTVGIGSLGTTNYATLADWKALTNASANITKYDQQSVDLDPAFTNNTDFIPSNGFMDNIGDNVGISTDINGNPRNVNAPDPGAVEFASLNDVVGPSIAYTSLSDTTSTNNRTLTVTISDVSGVQLGVNGPRLYYKKSTSGTYVFDNNPTKSGNDYTFTINYASIGGGVAGDIIEYYVAAQDSVGNVTTNPTGGTGFNPPGTGAPATPNNFTIIPFISGTYTVGSGGNYLNLTALANVLTNGKVVLNGNAIFELLPSYDGTTGETLPINFGEFTATDSAFTVIIRPASGASGRITSGDPTSSLQLGVINLTGGDRYTFDGRPGGIGTTNEWTIRNTRTAASIGSVIRFVDGATNNVLRNLNLESQATSTTTGLVYFHTSASTDSVGNSFNTIRDNMLSGRTDVASSHSVSVYSGGTNAAPNKNNSIINNTMVDFTSAGVNVGATGNGPNWIISNNNFYNTTTSTTTQNGILISSVNALNMEVAGNFIGGNMAGATGTWTNSGNVVVSGINIAAGVSKVVNNTISNITNTGTGTTARIRGILIGSITSGVNVRNNQISNLSTTGIATGIGFNAAVASGISLVPSGTFVNDTIANNTISNISIESTNALTVTNIATGIALSNLQDGVVASNRIYDIKNKTTGSTANQPPVAAGITNSFANNNYVINNMISLGETESTNTQFAGLWQVSVGTGNNHHYYFNSVVIGGVSSGNFSSYGFVRGTDTSTLQNQVSIVKNNILYMTRSGAGSANFAIGNRGSMAAQGFTSDYNLLYNTDQNNIGYWNNTGYNFAGYQAVSNQDANSKSVPVTFVNTNTADLHLSGASVGNSNLAGTPITGITIDFDNDPRNPINPYMGADEANTTLPVSIAYFNGRRQALEHLLTWKASCTINTTFTIERSNDGRNFSALAAINATPNDCLNPFYFTDSRPLEGMNYYRLKLNGADGRNTYSIVIALINKNAGFEIVGLNPSLIAGSIAYLNITSAKNTSLSIKITDVNGRLVQQSVNPIAQGSGLIQVDVNKLASGVYHLTGTTPDGYLKTIRFVKK